MSQRNIDTTIKNALLANDDFSYAHLVKFERAYDQISEGVYPTDGERYAYYTDGATDISFNDGNGTQIYRANRIQSVGQYSETTILLFRKKQYLISRRIILFHRTRQPETR